jgi:hypothetical protein
MELFCLIRRLLLRLAQISNRERALLAEAVLGLLGARLSLILVSFPRLAQRFGTLVPPGDPRIANADVPADDNQILLAREVSWAVTRAARYMPFSAVCLPQAMAAHAMLKRRGIASVLHIGAANGQTTVDAHAWLDAAGIEVTGYPVAERLAEIACFV